MAENVDEHILVLTGLTDQPEAERAERGAGDRVLKRIVNTVSVSALKENMQAFNTEFHQQSVCYWNGSEKHRRIISDYVFRIYQKI